MARRDDLIRDARMTLGDGLRRAHSTMAKLTEMVEKGYRWEDEENEDALEAAETLHDVAFVTKHDVREILGGRWKSVTVRARLKDAEKFLTKGVKLLASIEDEEMSKLAQKWVDEGTSLQNGHEAYFLHRFGAAMRVLRLAWNKLFYATQMPTVRRTILTERESSAYYNPMVNTREAVHMQADKLATRTDLFVEVYDADNDLVYVAKPGSATTGEGLRKQRMSRNESAAAKREHALFKKIWSYDY